MRIAQTLEFLLEKNEVDVAYISHSPGSPRLKEHEPRIRKEMRFEVPFHLRVIQAAKTLFNRFPTLANHFHNAGMQKMVNDLAPEYDMLVCSGAATAAYGFEPVVKRKILDMTDSLTMNYINASSVSSGLKKLLFRFDAMRMRRFEKECSDVFDTISYISEKDRHYVGLPSEKTVCIPNCVKTVAANDVGRRADTQNIIFVGKMDYEPNITAVRFFVKEVMPLLSDSCVFHVVGANPSGEIKALDDGRRVIVTGYVDSVSDYYDQADLVVAPMLSGSGVQNKILEAMAHGACVITTEIGAEGLDSVRGGLEVTPPDATVMARCITDLLQDPGKRTEIARKGKSLVEKYFGQDTVRDIFYKSFCGMQRPRTAL